MLTHFSLFTGIGGIDLAAEWAGFETVGQCEFADYPTRVLEKHWPNVPRWRDIRTVTKESFYEKTGLQKIDLISGGFPCQPFSTAGKRKGKEDNRYLWPEMCRVIKELRPDWVLGENVANFANMAIDDTLLDLENIGYKTLPFIIPACSIGAPHKRERVFIVAHSSSDTEQHKVIRKRNILCDSKEGLWRGFDYSNARVVDGVSNRVDRLKCLGNAVVPQQVYPILKAIAEIEKRL